MRTISKSMVLNVAVICLFTVLPVDRLEAQQRVKIGYSSISSIFLGIWMAKEIGAYEKYGLRADLVYIGSGSVLVQAMLGGDLHMAGAASNAVVNAILRGAPLVAVGSVTNRPAMTLWVQPEITRPEQLVGKVLGISRHGSTTHFMTLVVLEKYGLKDKVKIQPFGGAPETDAAFNAGLIAGAVRSIKPGPKAHALTDLAELPIPFSMDLLTVKRDFYKTSPKAVEGMVRAYVEGVAVLKTQKNKAFEVLRKYMRRVDVDDSYEYAFKYLDRVPRVDPAVIQTVLNWEGKSEAPFKDFFDNTIIDRLTGEGFIDQLYKGEGK